LARSEYHSLEFITNYNADLSASKISKELLERIIQDLVDLGSSMTLWNENKDLVPRFYG
jgi:hypothetical protein